MVEVFIGLGSNLGNSRAVLLAAMADMGRIPGYREISRSGCWRSAPIGGPAQPDCYNAALKAAYGHSAMELLSRLRDIENRHGRIRGVINGPRTLDLDILLFGSELISTPELVVPHPRLAGRAFVLLPLRQLGADGLRVPGTDCTIAELRQMLANKEQQRIEEVTWDICGG